jgi:hypothetical protein
MSSRLARKFKPLPAISDVDRADDHLGHLLSDLDSLTSEIERYAGETVPIGDHVFLSANGIAPDDEPDEYVDPAIIARLLVFANELEEDGETVLDYGRRIRGSLLWIYRERVFEPNGRSRARGGSDAS